MTTATTQLPRSAPEAQSIASSAILGFIQAAEQQIHDLHSLLLLRHGQVVAEGWWAPYAPDEPHMLFSLSKSFTSTAIGLAVAEGRLSIDDPVLSFFPGDAPDEISQHLAAMRVRHLLSMSTGHATDTMPSLYEHPDGHWVKAFLAVPVEFAPGTHFLYNTGATYMLSAIIQQLTGVTLLEYLRPRLLDPLGIEQAAWATCPRGINVGGFGLSITTESIARFGQLYLQQGVWQGQQIVPAAWVAEATVSQIDNSPNENSDWAQGYGYQFWRCRHNAYRGDGAFGQFCIVMPDQDAVLAITSGVGNMQAVLNLVWEHLLPALGPAPLPADDTARTALRQKLSRLAFIPPQGQPSSPLAARVSGRTYRFEPNELEFESIGFTFGAAGCEFAIRDERGDHRIVCGYGAWHKGITTFVDRGGPQPVVGAGAWMSEDTYLLKLYYYATPFRVSMNCRFVEDRLLFDFALNVSFGPTEFPQLEGRLLG
jgi:CubicO group peptidase (beta-lactamase class C family)